MDNLVFRLMSDNYWFQKKLENLVISFTNGIAEIDFHAPSTSNWKFLIHQRTMLVNNKIQLPNGPNHTSTDLQGHYRQSTETTGMYSPFKKHVSRAPQITPSKNCANLKIIPSQAPLLPPLDYPRRHLPSTELCKNSHSLPQLEGIYENSPNLSHRNLNISHSEVPCIERPYTPNEKRYNPNFGKKMTENKPRPRSSCIYENIQVKDDFCGRNNVYRVDFNPPNIRVNQFPTPEFSQMYIQDNFE
ncbi:hypothetical protein HHI36_005660 [Cryptolaemus montrouzieri]|uniref:Uncharacterized protein n=1 Tax=Cryptolaemus montrouzieri TaxID=559131 RepID=A0ABD2NVM9_9CUCU